MRSSRPYVQLDPAVIEQARQMDLLSYLRAYEPNNLVRVGGSVYCTREHDSLKISNGKWFWWSRGIGGVSALDYLIKVKDYGFVEAVEALTGGAVEWTPPQTPKKDESKVLLLPPKNKDCNRVMQYLFGRGIDYQLIQECIADGTIYESADYHNAVFVGKDKSGMQKYAALRSTLGSPFKQDASGSDKNLLSKRNCGKSRRAAKNRKRTKALPPWTKAELPTGLRVPTARPNTNSPREKRNTKNPKKRGKQV